MRLFNWNGWIVIGDLNLPRNGGIKVDFLDKGRWEPACMFPNLEEKTLFEPNNNQDWNWATEFRGMVPEYMVRQNQVYWNYVINFNGIPKQKSQKLRIIRYASGGRIIDERCQLVDIDQGETVFIKDWKQWQGAEIGDYEGMEPNRQCDPKDAKPGWTVANCTFGQPRLTIFGRQTVDPISYCPELSGKYDVYLCMKEEILECVIELPGMKTPEWIRVKPSIMPFNRFWKEIHLGAFDFKSDDHIVIHQANPTTCNPTRRFGDIFYFKMVPEEKRTICPRRSIPCQEITFYSEPYSLAYYHNLQNEQMAERLVEQYASLGVDRIVCQMGRTGAFVLFPSQISSRGRAGELKGDDQQLSSGVADMMANMNILEVLSGKCRQKGLRFLANMGINSSVKGSVSESKFAMEHPEYYHHHLLDFTLPKVLDFATENFIDMAKYDIDGIDISHTRYPYYQTTDTIVAFQRMLVEKLGYQRRQSLELSMSFVTGDPEYYRAIEIMLKENLIDVLVPANLMCIYPIVDLAPYVELAHRYHKRVLGMMDGWGYGYAGINTIMLPRPDEYDRLATHFLEQGADGLYFYQSEQILDNIFQRRLIKTLKA